MDTSDDGYNTNKYPGSGYVIGITMGIIVFISTVALAYFCNRAKETAEQEAQQQQRQQPQQRLAQARNNHDTDVEMGLDEVTLQHYPTLLYSKSKHENKNTTTSSCSICLSDYVETDMLRLLPECQHLFHQKCVDPWLHQHPSCPMCRQFPVPSPVSTPLAEVAPLARYQATYQV